MIRTVVYRNPHAKFDRWQELFYGLLCVMALLAFVIFLLLLFGVYPSVAMTAVLSSASAVAYIGAFLIWLFEL